MDSRARRTPSPAISSVQPPLPPLPTRRRSTSYPTAISHVSLKAKGRGRAAAAGGRGGPQRKAAGRLNDSSGRQRYVPAAQHHRALAPTEALPHHQAHAHNYDQTPVRSSLGGTASHSLSTLDSRLTSIDGLHRVSDCLSDLSLHNQTEKASYDATRAPRLPEMHESARELPSALRNNSFSSASAHHEQQQEERQRASWHGVDHMTMMMMSNSATQVNTSQCGHVRGPARGVSVSTSPAAERDSFSTPPPSTALSLHPDGTLRNSFATSAPPQPGTARRTQALSGAAGAAGHERDAVRRSHRLDSAQARRFVVSKQRHRKLFDIASKSAPPVLRGSGGGDGDTAAPLASVDGASAGWMAALSTSALPTTLASLGDGESPHLIASAGLSKASAQAASNDGAAFRSPVKGSFNTSPSLTSLQNRLWQYTTPHHDLGGQAAGVVKSTGPPGATMTRMMMTSQQQQQQQKAMMAASLPLPPVRDAPVQRTAAATISQGRQGLYCSGLNQADTTALARRDVLPSSGPALADGSLVLRQSSHTAATTTTAAALAAAVPVSQWTASLTQERRCGRDGREVAQWLVQRLLNSQGTAGLDRSRYASALLYTPTEGTGYGDAGGADAVPGSDDGGMDDEDDVHRGDLLGKLSEKAAIAAYLLSSLVESGLPRHQQSVLPYVRMLIEFAFVPDTPAVRAALGTNTVQDEALIDRLAAHDDGTLPLVNATLAAAATLPGGSPLGQLAQLSLAADEAAGGGSGGPLDLVDLLAPAFTRKTYITAHFEVSTETVGLAHEVRCRELHLRNVPRLLERTHKNWMRGLMRAVLRAWRHLCQERRVQEQRQRARWALRWTLERVRISLRRWRSYAAVMMQMAQADTAAKAALAQKRAYLDRLAKEAAAMEHSSTLLHETLQRQDEERESTERTITQSEIAYQRLLRQVREVDSVGSLMLSSLLLTEAPPRFRDASAITALVSVPPSRVNSQRSLRRSSVTAAARNPFTQADGEASLSSSSLSCASDDSLEGDEEQLRLPHAVTALPSLLQWATERAGEVEDKYAALFPVDADSTAALPGEAKEQRGDDHGGPPLSSAPSAPRHSRYEPPAPTRAVPTFASLLKSVAGAGAAGATAEASTSETVLLPLHQLLLLMRGCSGGEETAADGTAKSGVGAVEVFSLDKYASNIDSDDGDGEHVSRDNTAGAAGPTFAMIRAVQCADAAVLREANALLDKDEGVGMHEVPAARSRPASRPESSLQPAHLLHGDADDTDDAAPVTGVPVFLRLSAENRENLQRVCRVVVDAYEQLTGTACVVTGEQLFERSRGTLLVFLAALMRHYTNWMVRRAQQSQLPPLTPTAAADSTQDGGEAEGRGAESAQSSVSSAAQVGEGEGSTETPAAATTAARPAPAQKDAGVPHSTYREWFHPPHNHRRWLGQVRRQAEWIGLSFSAMHDAMRLATMPSHVLTLRQQDEVSGLLAQFSLTEFVDLLPNSPDQTMQCYVDMIGVVERHAPSLHLLFYQFALPMAQLRADDGAALPKPRRPVRQDAFAPSSGAADRDAYVTANTVWRLLCLAGLAGEEDEEYCAYVSRQSESDTYVAPPLSATLHRPAVFSLIEQVTQSGVESTAIAPRRSSSRALLVPNSSGKKDVDEADGTGTEALSGGAMTSPLVMTVSCNARPRTCYASALREGRHLDLRSDTGAVCVNYTQFIKIFIRLAHAWQCQQQQREEAEHEASLQRRVSAAVGQGSGVPSVGLRPARTSSTPGADVAKPLHGPGAAGKNDQEEAQSRGRGTSVANRSSVHSTGASSVGGGASPFASSLITYESGNYSHTLLMPYFDGFFGSFLIPRLLGLNRWMTAAQRATCSRPVLQVLARHHDALLEVFNDYQRPREARGVRSCLPPPYATVLASQLFARVVDAGRQTSSGLTVGGGRSMSHVQRASLMYGLSNSVQRQLGIDSAQDADDNSSNCGGDGAGGRRHTQSQQHKRASKAAFEDTAVVENLRASVAAAQLRDVSIVSVLQWSDVLTMAKDLRWWSIRRLTEESLRRCFDRVLADATREGDAMFFSEFAQLLCAVAHYAFTSPAMPLEEKLSMFLQKYVFSPQD